jgi:hypothetical protein
VPAKKNWPAALLPLFWRKFTKALPIREQKSANLPLLV